MKIPVYDFKTGAGTSLNSLNIFLSGFDVMSAEELSQPLCLSSIPRETGRGNRNNGGGEAEDLLFCLQKFLPKFRVLLSEMGRVLMIQGKEEAPLGWLDGNAVPSGLFGAAEMVECRWIWESLVGRARRPAAPEGKNKDTGSQNVSSCH